jgi:hypothetical protein
MKHDFLNHPQADGDVQDVYAGKDHFGRDWSNKPRSRFWRGMHLSRRVFFQSMSAAVGGYFLLPSQTASAQTVSSGGRAKNVIFVFLNGAASHTDTFDLKVGSWTPAYFNPTQYGNILWPQGLMPKLAEQMDSISVVRSVRAWATAHGIAQSWAQLARNPANALARLAPHIGSVISLELGAKDRTLPAFMSLNVNNGPSEGYLKPEHAPMYISPNGGGLPGATHPGANGEAVFNRRYELAVSLDADLRAEARYGEATEDFVTFNNAARKLMYNPRVSSIFTFDQNQRNLYGNNGFGNACITARNLLRANMGTRFVQITLGGWDQHVNIYGNNTNLQSTTRTLDNGLAPLIADLRQDGLLDETLIVVMGEFGRTVGALNEQNGRDHHPQQAVLFAGAGIRGRNAIGETNPTGAFVTEPGWSASREVRAEDIGATIYSALGIDWTKVRKDYPLGRGFEYIPGAETGEYGPIRELWG